jgi:hypothetical protein
MSMNRRQILALSLVAAAPTSPRSRPIYDFRLAEDRQQFIQYANQKGHPFPEAAFNDCYRLFSGPPTRVETHGVDILVPHGLALRVWRYRERAGISGILA